jgi:tetraacyldisaccharide 4'-kinase
MNFNDPLIKPLRLLLFPFSIIYGSVVWLRNTMYDKQWLKSASFNLPVICVGNLSAGGTGKSPMVEYLVNFVMSISKPAIISRGYKRKTKGYLLAGDQTTTAEIGDEPMQFHERFPDIAVAVGEERIVAIPKLLNDRPDTRVIILDDAFQHRSAKAGMNILLTDYNDLFTRDLFLPTGNLRDARNSYKRADIIVITKCPENMNDNERDKLIEEISPLPGQSVFFTTIVYGHPYHIITKQVADISAFQHVLMVTGIANPAPLAAYLVQYVRNIIRIDYRDHHLYDLSDLERIRNNFLGINSNSKIIITTEKDATRLLTFKKQFDGLPIYVIPIRYRFLFGDERRFNNIISTFIEGFGSQTTDINDQKRH